MLDAWGGMEQVFSELWDLPGVAGPVITWGRALHPDYLRRTPGVDVQRIDVKSLSGIRIPSRPRGLRGAALDHRLRRGPAAQRGAVALSWNLTKLPAGSRFGAGGLFLVHYDHCACLMQEDNAETRRYFERVDAALVCSQGQKRVLEEFWGFRKPIAVVPNGLSAYHEHAARSEPAGAARTQGPFRIGCVARLSAEKGIPLLLHAAAILRQAGRPLELHIAGEGADAASLRAQADQLGIAGLVRWHGGVDDTAAFYRGVDVVCLPSVFEAYPLVCMEAAAHGRPMVASASGGIPEIVIDGETGVLVPPTLPLSDYPALGGGIRWISTARWVDARSGRIEPPRVLDPQRLAAALAGLIDDPARCEAMGRNARAQALARFSRDRFREDIRACLAHFGSQALARVAA